MGMEVLDAEQRQQENGARSFLDGKERPGTLTLTLKWTPS